jgi:hypothetical protein
MTHRDPTFEAIAAMEEMPCTGCLWRQWDVHSMRAWCDHDRWIGNELHRPQTNGINKLHRCSDFELKLGKLK